jgi:hypothetical protein
MSYSEGKPCYKNPCPFNHLVGRIWNQPKRHNQQLSHLVLQHESQLRTVVNASSGKPQSSAPTVIMTCVVSNMKPTLNGPRKLGRGYRTSVTIDTRLTNGIANIHTTIIPII